MKKKNKERRVINIDKECFDVIKKYCNKNTLHMSSWMVKNSIEKIPEKDLSKILKELSIKISLPLPTLQEILTALEIKEIK